jgi:hypothetical protein
MVAPSVPPAVQTVVVVVLKDTGKPDEEVALTVTGDWIIVLLLTVPKVMVWATCCTHWAYRVADVLNA